MLHTLKQHGDAIKEAKRGQIAVTLEDIAHYQEYLKNPDFKHIQEESGRIVYAKQINGYAVVIEEALSGQDKLRFFDMWKLKGQLNKEVLLSHSQRPNTTPSLDLEGYMPSSGANPTTPELKNQAQTLYTQAQEQEGGFKTLLEGLKEPSAHLEANSVLKSVGSIESKIKRKKGDIGAINDFLRGAVIAPNREYLDSQLVGITKHLQTQGIPHRIEYKANDSGYKGVHIQFNYNGVASEIQLHTAQNWEIKKQLDEIYHILREQTINPTLSKDEMQELIEKSRTLAQALELDIKDFASFEVISTEFSGSAISVNSKNEATEGNLTHILRLKSNSKMPSSPGADTAYNRPDSVLRENANFSGGKGNNLSSG
ncbi:hypothetical protein FNE76_08030, partial [Helicobacter mehlei]